MADPLGMETHHAVLERAEPEVIYDTLTTPEGLDN